MIKFLIVLLFPLFGYVGFIGKTTNSNKSNLGELSLINQELRLDEIRFLQDNISYYYKRSDISKSNMNFDNDFVMFYDDGTGKYHQTDGKEYKLIWRYVEDNQIQYTISDFRENSDLVVIWENIRIEGQKVHYTEYYTHSNGVNSLATAIRGVCERDLEYVSR